MAASKSSPLFSDADRAFLAEQLGLVLFYARRDANTVVINRQRKSENKIKFDRDHFRRVQVLCAAFEAATGIRAAERQPADMDGFMNRIGRKFEAVQETQPEQPQNSDNVPWDMNF